MKPWEYQEADHAVVSGWLADATLTASLEGLYTWFGFKTTYDEMEKALTTPVVGPGLPAAAGSYLVRYPSKVERFLGGDTRARQSILDIIIRVQPTATSAVWTTLLAAASAIKERIDAQQASESTPLVDGPLVPISPAGRWPQARMLLTAWMGET